MAYGGIIKQSDADTSRNAYFYDVDMPEEYEGPSLFIDGEKNFGGKINDPWCPTGFPLRKANVFSKELWDIDCETDTPNLVSTL